MISLVNKEIAFENSVVWCSLIAIFGSLNNNIMEEQQVYPTALILIIMYSFSTGRPLHAKA